MSEIITDVFAAFGVLFVVVLVMTCIATWMRRRGAIPIMDLPAPTADEWTADLPPDASDDQIRAYVATTALQTGRVTFGNRRDDGSIAISLGPAPTNKEQRAK